MFRAILILSLFGSLITSRSAHGSCKYRDLKIILKSNRYTFLASFVSVGESTVRLKVIKNYGQETTGEIDFILPKESQVGGGRDQSTFNPGKTYFISTNEYKTSSTGPGKINLRPCDKVAESQTETGAEIQQILESPDFRVKK